MNRFEMRERLENKLTKKRFEHSLGVESVSYTHLRAHETL